MNQIFILSIIALILSGCAAAAHEVQPATITTIPNESTESGKQFTDGTMVPTMSASVSTTTSSVITATNTERTPLAAIWRNANQGGAEATALLYSAVNITNGSTPPMAFWRLPLGASSTAQQVMAVGSDSFTTVPGNLSPDSFWLAYMVGRDAPFTLRVARVDGSDNRMVSQQIGLHDGTCIHTFAWSATGDQLAFVEPWEEADEFGQALFVYHPHMADTPREVVRLAGARLVGWDHENRLLVLVATAYQHPLELVAFDMDTGTSEVLIQMPTNETAFCTRMSPNRERVLIQLGDHDYLYDATTQQLTAVDVTTLTALWSSDSTAVLEFSGDEDRATRVVPFDGLHLETAVDLAPTNEPGHLFGILSASPDGRYLVVCDTADGQIHRSLLYTIDTQQWQPITQGSACIAVAGWLTAP